MIIKLPVTLLLCLLSGSAIIAQNQKAIVDKSITTSDNINGYLEYLPKNYNNVAALPLIIYMHGDEGRGDGRKKNDLDPILTTGLPAIISQGIFPESVTVNGTAFQFIVLSPQYSSVPSDADMRQLIEYAIRKYKVNTSRIYLTGFSRGGGVCWSYAGSSVAAAKTFAALVPVAGAASPSPSNAYNIGDADLPVFATHNDKDGIVPVQNTIEYVALINERNPTPPAKKYIFNSNSHDAWTKTYDPEFKIEGSKNIYQWMLQYQKAEAAPLPVVLTAYKAFASGERQVTVSWTTSDETENDHFNVERSADGTNFTSIATVAAKNTGSNYVYIDEQPLSGNNFYRLLQTDINGTITIFKTLQVRIDEFEGILIFPNPASNQLHFKFTGKEQGAFTVTIVSVSGTAVKQWTFNKQSQTAQRSLPIHDLAAGKYILQVKSKTYKKGVAFIKN